MIELLKAKLKYAGLIELPPDEILAAELEAAQDMVNYRRNHEPTEDVPVPREYRSIWVEMAYAKILKVGADGQIAHSENGISRSYKSDGMFPVDAVASIPWAVR